RAHLEHIVSEMGLRKAQRENIVGRAIRRPRSGGPSPCSPRCWHGSAEGWHPAAQPEAASEGLPVDQEISVARKTPLAVRFFLPDRKRVALAARRLAVRTTHAH